MTALSGEHDACVAHLLALKAVNIWLTQRPDLPDGDDVYDIWCGAIRNSRVISVSSRVLLVNHCVDLIEIWFLRHRCSILDP